MAAVLRIARRVGKGNIPQVGCCLACNWTASYDQPVRPDQNFSRGAVAIAILLSVQCSRQHDNDRDLTLVPPGEVQQALPTPLAALPNDSACVPLWPVPVRLTGVLRAEQRLGPPGYGETPKQDEKISIFVLHLNTAIDVCADRTPDNPQPVLKAVKVLQVTGKLDLDRAKRQIGLQTILFGTLYRRAWGSDFTEVLIRVDSMPRQRSPDRSA